MVWNFGPFGRQISAPVVAAWQPCEAGLKLKDRPAALSVGEGVFFFHCIAQVLSFFNEKDPEEYQNKNCMHCKTL